MIDENFDFECYYQEIETQMPASTAPKLCPPAITMDKYSPAEFAAAGIFNVPRECVETAFKIAGVSNATLCEAEKIVGDFMSRKVN